MTLLMTKSTVGLEDRVNPKLMTLIQRRGKLRGCTAEYEQKIIDVLIEKRVYSEAGRSKTFYYITNQSLVGDAI